MLTLKKQAAPLTIITTLAAVTAIAIAGIMLTGGPEKNQPEDLLGTGRMKIPEAQQQVAQPDPVQKKIAETIQARSITPEINTITQTDQTGADLLPVRPDQGGTGSPGDPREFQGIREFPGFQQFPPERELLEEQTVIRFEMPDKDQLKYPRLGSNLDGIAARVENQETTALDAARETPIHQGESIAVTIHLDGESGKAGEIAGFLEENGGSPRNTGIDYIEAYVPVTLLGPTSLRPGVIRVRAIIPPEPNLNQ